MASGKVKLEGVTVVGVEVELVDELDEEQPSPPPPTAHKKYQQRNCQQFSNHSHRIHDSYLRRLVRNDN